MVLGVIKSVVSRVSGKGASGGANSLVAAGSSATSKVSDLMATVHNQLTDAEREWTCHCGHKFIAAGEWYPTEPSYCEAPGCPNPTFYLDGPGRALLEGGSMKAKSDSQSVGGRFK